MARIVLHVEVRDRFLRVITTTMIGQCTIWLRVSFAKVAVSTTAMIAHLVVVRAKSLRVFMITMIG
ncbi:hypothetical protein BLL36_27875 [Pseudomonas cedrina subsp. cedrina]|uniref:Uncharacterized protein n=1 Tax=Pseudomonas cedrina subsp. cedrina TaxID=76762 RepID=A0A1V2JWC8_PSECE|nr:hypothetical protein BLL36_27875 [Pseudomonas cedrina subsp. cedrina]